jgi:FKBP-type peptidyl-prolyl cis-trans isomerase FkpA
VIGRKENAYNKSFAYPPLKWRIKKEEVLTGFKESLLLFPKGTKVRLIIPSRLAYGMDGYKTIRAYTAILCDVEILNIIPTNPNYKAPPVIKKDEEQ